MQAPAMLGGREGTRANPLLQIAALTLQIVTIFCHPAEM